MTVAAGRGQIRCRQIEESDFAGVADCLTRGFPSRPRRYWTAAFELMARRPAVGNYPRFGVLLESDGRIVGALLQISFRRGEGASSAVYCNLSGWCLDPEFRGYAAMLNSAAMARKEATYLNISPARHTRKSIEALGFRRYCDGQFACLPVLSRIGAPGARIVSFTPTLSAAGLLSTYERDVLAEHAALGCRSLIAIADGAAYPFVFVGLRVFRRLFPCEQLIYCRDVADFVRFSQPIGRYLLAKASLICLLDANGPLAGLPGRYFPDTRPRYFKGPVRPILGDLSFTEMTIFGS
jgi:hypothetical protein